MMKPGLSGSSVAGYLARCGDSFEDSKLNVRGGIGSNV